MIDLAEARREHGELRAPFDRMAEEGVVGCCIDSDAGYRLAAGRLVAADFYHPAHQALFRACTQLAHLSASDLETLEARIEEAARIADVPVRDVRRLVEDRPLQRDRNGTLARRVAEAARARQVMHACAAVFNRLGAGERLDAVLSDVPRDLWVAS